jgi:hypothetical protein
MKVIDPQYDAVRVLLETGHIKSFPDIFQYIPKTTVYKDLGVNFNRFGRTIYDPSIFTMGELREIAELFGFDPKKLIDIAYEQTLLAKKKQKKMVINSELKTDQ